MEFSTEAVDNPAATQELHGICRKFNYGACKGPPQNFILMHMNQPHNVKFSHFKIDFNIIPAPDPTVPKILTK
jgi:hypothetical protein